MEPKEAAAPKAAKVPKEFRLMDVTDVCGYCGAGSVKRKCSRCLVVAFCNEDCMRRGWKAHKPLCRSPEEREAQGAKLYDASFRGDLRAVGELITGGANVNWVQRADGFTPLMVASQEGKAEVVRALLKAKANVEHAERKLGGTALTKACQMGHVEMVRALVEEGGADVNHARASDGFSPLDFAAQEGHAEIVRLLHEAGADVHHVDEDGTNALYLPSQNGHVQVVRELIAAGINVNHVWPEKGTTALFVAAQKGHAEVVRLLLEAGADPCVVDLDGHTALDRAKLNKQAAVVALLEAKLRVLGEDCPPSAV